MGPLLAPLGGGARSLWLLSGSGGDAGLENWAPAMGFGGCGLRQAGLGGKEMREAGSTGREHGPGSC